MSGETLEYHYGAAGATWANHYLWPVLGREIEARRRAAAVRQTVFDLGCGNGATCHYLHSLGFAVTFVDLSESGICIAKTSYPECRFEIGSAYDDLAAKYGRFPLVVSLEVVEHCYDPRKFAGRLFDLVEPGGTAFVSTPYHGYLKNVALAVTGKLDQHFTVLWDGGHVKFFSIRTLGLLLAEAGFRDIQFVRVGRVPAFAKSMVAIARRPEQS